MDSKPIPVKDTQADLERKARLWDWLAYRCWYLEITDQSGVPPRQAYPEIGMGFWEQKPDSSSPILGIEDCDLETYVLEMMKREQRK